MSHTPEPREEQLFTLARLPATAPRAAAPAAAPMGVWEICYSEQEYDEARRKARWAAQERGE